MTRSIWICPWDLESREPDAVLDELQGLGLTACSLGLSYHGGRMILPRHPSRFVFEQHPGAVYFPADPARYSTQRLKPVVNKLADLVPPFLAAAKRRNFPVWAWTVLCHNDHLGTLAPDCCIENAFGDRYSYALCPSNPDVQAYILTLCAEIAALDGIAGLDIEALSYMGYEHQSLHDKRAIALNKDAISLLSLCFCRHCRSAIGPESEALREQVKAGVRAGLPVDWEIVAAARRRTLLDLLARLRHAVGNTKVNLRVSTDPAFHGGKTALGLRQIAPYVDVATVTFFGASAETMEQQLSLLVERPLPVNAGFVFHAPDCASEQDVQRRLGIIESAALNGVSFYSFSMASEMQLGWLRATILN